VLFQLQTYLIGDGLHLLRVGAGADHKKVRKGGDAGQVQNLDIGRFFGFRRLDCESPGRLLGCLRSCGNLLREIRRGLLAAWSGAFGGGTSIAFSNNFLLRQNLPPPVIVL
jgi:hypothetical protein